jgi:hypothetical protein
VLGVAFSFSRPCPRVSRPCRSSAAPITPPDGDDGLAAMRTRRVWQHLLGTGPRPKAPAPGGSVSLVTIEGLRAPVGFTVFGRIAHLRPTQRRGASF